MSYEKPESNSKGYSSHENWEAFELVGEITLLPVEILGDLASETLEGFDSNVKKHD